jgi:hypothetical protein
MRSQIIYVEIRIIVLKQNSRQLEKIRGRKGRNTVKNRRKVKEYLISSLIMILNVISSISVILNK